MSNDHRTRLAIEMSRGRGAIWVVGLFVAAGCISAGSTTSPRANYGRAAMGLGFGVAAAAANRAITGDCWAACALPDQFCNRKTGLCETRVRQEDVWLPQPTVIGEPGMGVVPRPIGGTETTSRQAAKEGKEEPASADAGVGDADSPDGGSADAGAPPR